MAERNGETPGAERSSGRERSGCRERDSDGQGRRADFTRSKGQKARFSLG